MEKENYSIDDILAEVKRHKEQQEMAEGKKQEKEEKIVQPEEEKIVQEENVSPNTKSEENFEIQEVDSDEEETSVPKVKEEELNIVEEPQTVEEEVKPEEETVEEEEVKDDGMVDILNFTQGEEELSISPKKKVKFFKTKKGKIVKTAIICILIVLIVAGVAGFYILNNMLNNVAETEEQEETYNAVTYYDGMDFLQEDFPLITEPSAYDVYGYKDYLKSWYENGDPVRSSHVLNVLLIGEDTREEEISDTSRADSAIIASINIDTGVIHMTSVLRDLYVYYEVDGEGYYGKINESAGNGGLNTYITTLERTYKLAIDGYAVVNFASFPKIIDALGGVDINITSAEINEINNNPSTYDDVGEVYIEQTFEGTEGVMTLDGLQALAYCRIRHIDGDDKRADRQKNVLSQILNELKSGSTVDVVKAVNQLSKYTKTSYSKKELIELGNLALKDNWLGYTIQSSNVPATENRLGGQNFSVSYNNWIWIADIPKDAYEMQMAIYGKSNIQLNENRPDYISMGR